MGFAGHISRRRKAEVSLRGRDLHGDIYMLHREIRDDSTEADELLVEVQDPSWKICTTTVATAALVPEPSRGDVKLVLHKVDRERSGCDLVTG